MGKMMLGYIRRYNLELNPGMNQKFKFMEAPYTRSISSRGNKVKSKLFYSALDYDDVASTTKMLKENTGMIIVDEPFFLDDELKERVQRWVDWANQADPSEYDPFTEAKE